MTLLILTIVLSYLLTGAILGNLSMILEGNGCMTRGETLYASLFGYFWLFIFLAFLFFKYIPEKITESDWWDKKIC